MNRRAVHILLSLLVAGQLSPAVWAAGDQPDLNFKVFSPKDESPAQVSPPAQPGVATAGQAGTPQLDTVPVSQPAAADNPTGAGQGSQAPENAAGKESSGGASAPDPKTSAEAGTSEGGELSIKTTPSETTKKPLLQGYIRVVPSGTKVPIIMDTAIDSDASQEGDEFAARTSEDLNIDGTTIVPAGSVIKGRLARIAAPRSLGRSGSVALKFDTVTTPDNRQIPIVANLVAHGGVVHARRGLKDVAIDCGAVAIPTVFGLGIGALAGTANSTGSHISRPEGALIGVGIGAAVGVVILLVKKGKKVDVRSGDELKIELAEDLRMPM